MFPLLFSFPVCGSYGDYSVGIGDYSRCCGSGSGGGGSGRAGGGGCGNCVCNIGFTMDNS